MLDKEQDPAFLVAKNQELLEKYNKLQEQMYHIRQHLKNMQQNAHHVEPNPIINIVKAENVIQNISLTKQDVSWKGRPESKQSPEKPIKVEESKLEVSDIQPSKNAILEAVKKEETKVGKVFKGPGKKNKSENQKSKKKKTAKKAHVKDGQNLISESNSTLQYKDEIKSIHKIVKKEQNTMLKEKNDDINMVSVHDDGGNNEKAENNGAYEAQSSVLFHPIDKKKKDD